MAEGESFEEATKVHIWFGIVGNWILGQHFIEGNLTVDIYIFWQFRLIRTFTYIFPRALESFILAKKTWFQNDSM